MRDTSQTVYRDNAQTGRTVLAAIGRALAGIFETLVRWQEVSIQRRRLLELDAHMLKDIGISRADAVREARRPFWDCRVHGHKLESHAGCATAATVVCCQR
jgi:uncharacterized protein YjiS (DUF1127 family)